MKLTGNGFVDFFLRNILRVFAFAAGILAGAVIGGMTPQGSAATPAELDPPRSPPHLLSADSEEDLSPESVAALDGDRLDLEMEQLRVLRRPMDPPPVSEDPQAPPHSREEYCRRSSEERYAQTLGLGEENRMAFINAGGLFNGGVCWWHSRLQRSALELVVFRPELPRPSEEQVNEMLRALERNERVIEIGGFSDWAQFTDHYPILIQRHLDRWQLRDGFLRQAWVRGLMGPSVAHGPHAAQRLRKLVQAIVHEVEVLRRVTYVKVQIPGITSHAWLVLSARPTDEGIDLVYLDSNYLQVRFYRYRYGDTAIELYGRKGFLPYVEQRGDFKKIDAAREAYCTQPARSG